MDSARNPKPALDALAQAFAPTRLIVEPLAFDADRPFGIIQRPTVPFSARLVIVNDDPDVAATGGRRRAALARATRGGPGGGPRPPPLPPQVLPPASPPNATPPQPAMNRPR